MTDTFTPARAELREVQRRREQKAKRREIKASRPKVHRPIAAGQRQPRLKDPAYLQFIRTLPCAVAHLGGCSGKTEAAHIRFSDAAHGKMNPGLQAKPDDRPWSCPLCATHHREGPKAQHAAKERAWWEAAGVDVLPLCLALSAAYEAAEPHAAALAVLRSRPFAKTRQEIEG
jgi:hypothetical protein